MTGESQCVTLGILILIGIIAAVSKMTTVDFANKCLLMKCQRKGCSVWKRVFDRIDFFKGQIEGKIEA